MLRSHLRLASVSHRPKCKPLGTARLWCEQLETREVLSTFLSPDQSYISELYRDFLGRNGTEAELDQWVAALPTSGSDSVIATIAGAPEARGRIVDQVYRLLLDRAPEANGRTGWINFLQTGQIEFLWLVSHSFSHAYSL